VVAVHLWKSDFESSHLCYVEKAFPARSIGRRRPVLLLEDLPSRGSTSPLLSLSVDVELRDSDRMRLSPPRRIRMPSEPPLPPLEVLRFYAW